jgi:hypothetical protein
VRQWSPYLSTSLFQSHLIASLQWLELKQENIGFYRDKDFGDMISSK